MDRLFSSNILTYLDYTTGCEFTNKTIVIVMGVNVDIKGRIQRNLSTNASHDTLYSIAVFKYVVFKWSFRGFEQHELITCKSKV